MRSKSVNRLPRARRALALAALLMFSAPTPRAFVRTGIPPEGSATRLRTQPHTTDAGQPYINYGAGHANSYLSPPTPQGVDGNFGSVGMHLELDADKRVVIVEVYDDSPAARANLKERVGWLITKIDGQSTESMSLQAVTNLMWGKIGTDVTLTLKAKWESPAEQTVTLRREESQPSKQPVLRIETGMHTGTIRQVGVDRAARFLVTSSFDKTARVWELATGRLLRVLRIPVGDGDDGKLYSVAITPDGNTVAAGGFTAGEWGPKNIYVFDRASGRLVRRLTGLRTPASHLAFSPDGALLAAVLNDKEGVRVWRTSDWAEVGRDTAYGEFSYGVAFDRAGRLATASLDGFVRLYDRSLQLLSKWAAPDGKQPADLSFSPDGQNIAVGYINSTKVDVLSGDALKPLYSPDVTGIDKGYTNKVAWSADGATLYAGGSYYDKEGIRLIRRWSDAGRGGYSDVPTAADNTIADIVALPAGGIVYSAAGPVWGVLDSNDRQVRAQTGQLADYRHGAGGLLTDATATTVRFSYEDAGKALTLLRLADRKLVLNPPTAGGLVAPRFEAPGIAEINAETKKLQLKALPSNLEPHESLQGWAITPDGERYLLATVFFIRLYNRNGRELWHVPAPGLPLGANISGNGQIALAAYGDGTIRWYRMTDGKELLAFFPHADRKRWVIWTPSGYYDASPGAEELIGWHVNHGRDTAADFFPVGQFRSVYYRPDVVSKILQTGDEQLALKEANEESGRKGQQAEVAQLLPPVVEVVAPADGAEAASNEVVVRYRLRAPSGEPVTEVRALVDGRPANSERGLALKSAGASATDVRELRVAVPEGESQVSIIAANRFTTSVPATVRVRARKPATHSNVSTAGSAAPNSTPGESFEIKPKLYVLAVGVSNYADPQLKLAFAAKDASDFAAVMAQQKGGLYRDVVVKLLTDEHASKDDILDGLDWIRKETTSKDVAMVLFAGHGVNDQDGRYFYLPYNTDLTKLLRTGVSFEDIKNTVSALAGKTLFFIDTCHSGNVLGGRRGTNTDIVGVVNELSSAENGAVVFAASTGNQYSLENSAWKNGAFTLAVIEGIGGRADYDKTGRGRITINMLDLYISERVKELTKGQQTPTTAKPNTVPDFLVAIKK